MITVMWKGTAKERRAQPKHDAEEESALPVFGNEGDFPISLLAGADDQALTGWQGQNAHPDTGGEGVQRPLLRLMICPRVIVEGDDSARHQFVPKECKGRNFGLGDIHVQRHVANFLDVHRR